VEYLGQVAGFVDLSHMDIATRLHIEEDLLSLAEGECGVLDCIGVVDSFWEFSLIDHGDERFFSLLE
jgi:hypothetical protein